jgi:ubiquitin C-terminal hydrolase
MNFKGLNNIGNTCYLNAGLQLIIHNKDLCSIIAVNSDKSDVLKNLNSFIKEYNSNDTKPLTPLFIKSLLGKKNTIFDGFGQEDSSEFIIYLLDILFEELKRHNTNININSLYEHTLNISIKCKLRSCLTISQHKEYNNFMIFNIDKSFENLDDCYREYKARVKLENDNLYYCEKCKDNRIASRRIEVIFWPKHLIIILKRFNQVGLKFNKNIDNIIVPLIWRHHYILKGFVYHSGSLYSGHYIYIGNYNNKWLIFDDNVVREINIQTFEKYKNNAYVYYFEKT